MRTAFLSASRTHHGEPSLSSAGMFPAGRALRTICAAGSRGDRDEALGLVCMHPVTTVPALMTADRMKESVMAEPVADLGRSAGLA